MTRTAAWAPGVVVLILAVTGCPVDSEAEPRPPEPAATPTPEAVVEPAELTVWIMDPGNAEVQATLDELGAAFEAENDGVTVTIQYIQWLDAHEQFTGAVAGGQVPDLAEMGSTTTPEFAEQGVLTPLDPPPGVRFVEGLAESGRLEGSTYGYPWYAGARALIYRSDVLEQAGVGAPRTWDELIEVADSIAGEADGLVPVQVGGGYQHMLQPLVWGAGGEIAERQDGEWEPRFRSDAGRETLEFFLLLWERGWSPEAAVEWGSGELRDAFIGGRSAMMVGGGWDLRRIIEANPDLEGDLGTALMPAGPAGSSDVVAGGSHLVVFEDAQQPDLAKAFAEYLIEPEQAVPFADQVGFLPGTVEGVEQAVEGDELLGVFGEQLVRHSRAYPVAGWWRTVENEALVPRVFQRLMREEVSVDEALAEIDAGIRDTIGQPDG